MTPIRHVASLSFLILSPSIADEVIVWESDFDNQSDAFLRGGSEQTIVPKTNGFTDANGQVLRVQLDAADSSRWGSVSPSINGDGTGGALNIPLASLGIQAGDTWSLTFSVRASGGGGFDLNDEIGGAEFRWNANDTPGFLPTSQNSLEITYHNPPLRTPGQQTSQNFTGTVPEGATHVYPFLTLYNVDTASGTFPAAFGYVDNIRLSFDRQNPPEPPTPPLVQVDLAELDQDRSGLPDLWEAQFNVTNLDPEKDNDFDGMNNLQESRFGTDPFDPRSVIKLKMQTMPDGRAKISWDNIEGRPGQLEITTDLGQADPWNPSGMTPSVVGNFREVAVNTDEARQFFRLKAQQTDSDGDGIPDWLEPSLGFDPTNANSVGPARLVDTDNDGEADSTQPGDLVAFNALYLSASEITPSVAQVARFLTQATFGPRSEAEIESVRSLGYSEWIDNQMALSATLTKPYAVAIKNDFLNNINAPQYAGYSASSAQRFVFGNNFVTGWGRAALFGQDRLRQRVAFTLSQILVASRKAAMLANQAEAIPDYYDLFLEHAFGSYEELLLEVSLHPVMGHYLSHIGNRKENPSVNRFPDENYAREIMQLFTIGLWELESTGEQKLDTEGNPIPTYGNESITELARVFTGVNYSPKSGAGTFGVGFRDDAVFMTQPMKVYASEHDFGVKLIPTGNGTTHEIPARSASDENGLQDVEDTVYQLVRHPNTAPFISRQLIQFLVTDNPSPAYVERVATIFAQEVNGKVGNLDLVIPAILLDDEARNPINHLRKDYFGELREPLVKTVQLIRYLGIGRGETNFLWWHWPEDKNLLDNAILQQPMSSPSVFNYFRPDYRMRGDILDRSLDSKVFGITDSYAAISVPNYFWRLCKDGIKGPGYSYPTQIEALKTKAENVEEFLDHLSLIFCSGGMGAATRDEIRAALNATNSRTERVRLGSFLALVSPEGACLK